MHVHVTITRALRCRQGIRREDTPQPDAREQSGGTPRAPAMGMVRSRRHHALHDVRSSRASFSEHATGPRTP